MNYPHVFQPGRLGSMKLKNRLIMSPMTMNYATENGLATEKLIRHYVERAKGGVGLIVVEGTYFVQEGKGYVNQLGLATDKHVEKLRPLTDRIHGLNNDSRIFIQIHHIEEEPLGLSDLMDGDDIRVAYVCEVACLA